MSNRVTPTVVTLCFYTGQLNLNSRLWLDCVLYARGSQALSTLPRSTMLDKPLGSRWFIWLHKLYANSSANSAVHIQPFNSGSSPERKRKALSMHPARRA